MKCENFEVIEKLAAEYALGTLRGSARKRFQALLETDTTAQAHLSFWEHRLGKFGESLAPVTPPDDLKDALLRMTSPDAAAANTLASGTPVRARLLDWLNCRLWPYVAGLGTAAALFAAVLINSERRANSPVNPLISTINFSPAATSKYPIYSAQLKASSMRWLVSISPDRNKLTVVAADDFLQLGRHQLQLWAITATSAPVALGALPSSRDASIEFLIPSALRGHDDVRYVISLERESGPKDGKPGGALLGEASALDEI